MDQQQDLPWVVRDPRLPDDRDWILTEDMIPTDAKGMPIPMLRIGPVTQIFFGKNSSWFYYLMAPREIVGYDKDHNAIREVRKESWMTLDGEPLDFRKDKSGNRYLSLADVERFAHAVAQNQRIDGAQLQRVLLMVKTCAQQHGIIA